MWVYSNNPKDPLTKESLTNRCSLDKKLGFWLDYWLFLHNDTTHSLWAARPLGIRAIIRAVEHSRGNENRIFRQQLKEELNDWLELIRDIGFLEINQCKPPQNKINNAADWNICTDWYNWFFKLWDNLSSRDLEHQLINSIALAIDKGNYERAMYLTRGLAAELGGDGFTARQLFRTAKNLLCDSGTYKDKALGKEELGNAIKFALLGGVEYKYEVNIKTTPTPINSNTWKGMFRENISPVGDDRGAGFSKTLEGIKLTVQAVHPEQALAKSLDITISELARIRRIHKDVLIFLLKTESVKNLDTKEEELYKVPGLPTPFRILGRGYFARIDAASNKPIKLSGDLSQLGHNWVERPHDECVNIWSILEKFSPKDPTRNTLENVSTYTKSSLSYLPNEMLRYLTICLSNQASRITDSGLSSRDSRWHSWDSKNVPLNEWESKVFDENFRYSHKKWRPDAPDLLFNQKVGLLKKIRLDRDRKEINSICEKNLRLLYGLRNKMVHGSKEIRSPHLPTDPRIAYCYCSLSGAICVRNSFYYFK